MNNQQSLKLNEVIIDLIEELKQEINDSGVRKYTDEEIDTIAARLEKLFQDKKLFISIKKDE